MDRQLFALSLGFAACILFPDRAFGQVSPRAVGLAGNQAVLELFTSPTSGTFTLIASLPDGRACVIASGDHFELILSEKPGTPA